MDIQARVKALRELERLWEDDGDEELDWGDEVDDDELYPSLSL